MMKQTPEGLIVGFVGEEQPKVVEPKADSTEETPKKTVRKPKESK